MTWDEFLKVMALLANVATIGASSIAIYLFLTKRKAIASAFRVLLNFSSQLTLSELRSKFDRLNELTAADPEQIDDVINILNEIVGQIRGNQALAEQFDDLIPKLSSLAEDRRRLNEPRKRALISELRERLRHVNVENYGDLIGDNK